MSAFKRISVAEAKSLMAEGNTTVVDVRDAQSYATACIDGAIHISNDNLGTFVNEADKDVALIVYCYHGNSSQAAAQFFAQHGFSNVYSMDGGFEAWSQD